MTELRTNIRNVLQLSTPTMRDVYYMNAPLTASYPFITYQLLNSSYSIDSETGYESVMVQINIFNTEYNLTSVESDMFHVQNILDNCETSLETTTHFCYGIYRDFSRVQKNIDENKKTYWQGIIQYRILLQKK